MHEWVSHEWGNNSFFTTRNKLLRKTTQVCTHPCCENEEEMGEGEKKKKHKQNIQSAICVWFVQQIAKDESDFFVCKFIVYLFFLIILEITPIFFTKV